MWWFLELALLASPLPPLQLKPVKGFYFSRHITNPVVVPVRSSEAPTPLMWVPPKWLALK
jgi:hypothetical protein